MGKQRYSQKALEFIHLATLVALRPLDIPIVYISSSAWRSALGITMTKEDKKNNAKLSKAKKLSTDSGCPVDKKKVGVRGKIGKKHLAVRYINSVYNLDLLMKDNDIADAIALGLAYLKGAVHCDGT